MSDQAKDNAPTKGEPPKAEPKNTHPDGVAKAIVDLANAHGFAIDGDGFTLTRKLGGMVARHSYKGA